MAVITQAPSGKWRIGKGRAIYKSKEEAERVWKGYQAAAGISVRRDGVTNRKVLRDFA